MEGGELHSHVNFHIIFGRQKSFFQDGLKKVTLSIAKYRVYLSTALESHAKCLILQRLLSNKHLNFRAKNLEICRHNFGAKIHIHFKNSI